MISAIIFASGYSKRLKVNKLLTEIEGKPLIERVIQQVILSQVDEIILVYREKEIMKIGEKYNLKCIYNKNADRGISESLKLGVLASSNETDAYMFFVGDQVFLTYDVVDEIIACHKMNCNDIVIPMCKGEKTNPVCFPSAFRNELLSLEGDTGGRQIIHKQKDRLNFLEISSENLYLDLDTEQDLVAIENFLKNNY